MSTVTEIRDALKRLPVQEAQNIAQWLQKHLEHQGDTKTTSASQTPLRLPDYAARRRMIFGDKVLPNMVLLGREQERWCSLGATEFCTFDSRQAKLAKAAGLHVQPYCQVTRIGYILLD